MEGAGQGPEQAVGVSGWGRRSRLCEGFTAVSGTHIPLELALVRK